MKISILAIGEEKPDFVSRRIQSFLGTNYSHAAILVEDHWLYHATAKGFHQIPLHLVLPGHVIRHRFDYELNQEQSQYALGWLQGALGHEYSQSQYLGFLFPWLRRFVANGNSKTICSEAVGQFMFDCLNIREARLYACDFLSPKDVVEIAYATKRNS